MKFIAGLGVGIALTMGGAAAAQERDASGAAQVRRAAASADAAEAAASEASTRQSEDEAAAADDRGPARRFTGGFGSEAVIGPFKRPLHLRGERPDYMRGGRGAVGLAVSFRLGG